MNLIIHFLKNQDKVALISFLSTVLVSLLIIALFFFFNKELPPKLPLFYSLPWGDSQLVAKQQFLILSGILMLMGLVNTFLTYQLHPAHKVLKRILMFSLTFISIIILITVVKVLIIFI